MSLIRDALVTIRTELGFDTAKAFYRYLESRRKLEFNYAHYMKIEGAKALPSPSMISTISGALEPHHADRLTIAFCETLFPNQRHLFKNAIETPAPAKARARRRTAIPQDRGQGEGATLVRQQYLTEGQIAAICRSELHYSLFLVLTLARSLVDPAQLASLLNARPSDVDEALRDLERARITRSDGGKVASISIEMRFPKADSEPLRKWYEQMDGWDLRLNKRIGFETLLNKMMLRRVSGRYLGVIVSHANVLMDLIRAAQEIHPDYNDDVLLLNLTISRGRLPG